METINIPDIIRAKRAELGLTQMELAKRLGLKNRYPIADWETSRSKVSAENYIKIMSLRRERKRAGE